MEDPIVEVRKKLARVAANRAKMNKVIYGIWAVGGLIILILIVACFFAK